MGEGYEGLYSNLFTKKPHQSQILLTPAGYSGLNFLICAVGTQELAQQGFTKLSEWEGTNAALPKGGVF